MNIRILWLLVASCIVSGCGDQFSAWSIGGASMGVLQKGMLAPSLPTKTLADVGR